MRYGAIDIGTNAVRLIIKEVHRMEDSLRSFKVCYTRVPIRLGADVFTVGEIGEEKREALLNTIKAFRLLMEVQGVSEYRACSTSAMREAKNGKEIIDYIRSESGVDVEIISGQEEAEALMANFKTQRLDPNQHYLFIDVGGGSTEFTLIKGRQRLLSKSFKIGTVRTLLGKVDQAQWSELAVFAKRIKDMDIDVIGIGTGGNINRIYKEAGKTQLRPINRAEIQSVKNYIEGYSYDERIHKLKLKPDRADVILPAADIYLRSMELAGVDQMLVPKLGLSDGLILGMIAELKPSV